MTTALFGARESFLLVTLNGFALRRRSTGAGPEWVDTNLGEKPCVLLAFLALVRTPVPRQLLCDLLWQGAESGRARNSLRQALFRLRRVIGESAVLETSQGVLLARGVVAVDLIREIEASDKLPPDEGMGPRLAEAFGHTSRSIGTVFEDWRGRVRRQLSQGHHHSVLPALIESGLGAGQGAAFSGSGTEQSSRSRLEQLYRLSSHGIPITVWVTGRPESELRHSVDSFAADCRSHGACVAAVSRRVGAGYARSALEREIAEVVWPLPGAAGIRPEHHAALERAAKGLPVEHTILREATIDLIAAVAENAPLLITLGDPGRYSLGALTTLVTDLAALRDRAVMLLVAEHSGVRPVHPLCIEVPMHGTGSSDRTSRPRPGVEDRMMA